MARPPNDTFMKFYRPMPEDPAHAATSTRDGPAEMEVILRYNEGGMNYFNYKTETRGFYLHMSPVRRSDGCISRMLMDDRGRKVLVEEAARRNKKRGAALADIMEPHRDEIAELAIAQDWQGVLNLVQRAMGYPVTTMAAE